MVYFCYIHRKTGGVPHFEVLGETSRAGAITHATDLLAQRPDAVKAELWEDESLVLTVPPTKGLGDRDQTRISK
jgi:hypothetical protein